MKISHNFYDYDDLQPKITPPKHFSRQYIPGLHNKKNDFFLWLNKSFVQLDVGGYWLAWFFVPKKTC